MVSKINKLEEIPSRTYEGYLWMSDQQRPIQLNGESFDFGSVSLNPFIIEGLLYSKEEEVSISIKHTGQYHINEFKLKDLNPGTETVDEEYLPHRLNGVKKLKFKQIWIPEKDHNCANMEVMKMSALVFTGFKK